VKCPVCDETLLISSRESIEIDHCPQCRGVWLDRGELDKIIERAAPVAAVPSPRRDDEPRRDYGRDDEPRRDYDRDDDRYRRKKKRSLLEDLFDFD
jgi:Zn-finger nucleic acid-binding protein